MQVCLNLLTHRIGRDSGVSDIVSGGERLDALARCSRRGASEVALCSFAAFVLPLLVSCGASNSGIRTDAVSGGNKTLAEAESRYHRLLMEARSEERRQYLALAERTRLGIRESGAMPDYTNNFVPPPMIPQGGMTEEEYQLKLKEEWDKEQRRSDERIQRMRDARAAGYERKANEVMRDGPFCEFGGPSKQRLRRAAEKGISSLYQMRESFP